MTMNEMDRLADLKNALYPAEGPGEELRARVLTSLTAQDAVSPRPARRGVPVLVAGAAAIVVVGAVLQSGMGDPGGTRGTGDRGTGTATVRPVAFTVHVNVDGSVTFTANDVIDTAAATRALNRAGIAGRVINDITPGCTTKGSDLMPTDLHPDNTIRRGLGTSSTVTLRSSDYPAGGGLLVVVTSHGASPRGQDGRDEGARKDVPPDPVSVAVFAFDTAGKIPTCVDFRDPGSSSGKKPST
jgi:hypothetical protein